MVAYADALVLVCDFAIFVIDSMEALPASRAKKVVVWIANLHAKIKMGLAVRNS
ncbi:hypothetical protein Plhal703r1_c04g0024471 [Plasmopara halstedii]